MTALDTTKLTSTDSPCPDCYPFLNWQVNRKESESEKALVLLSLVATVKFQPALNDSLESKAVQFLESMHWDNHVSADAFLGAFGPTRDESSTNFGHSIEVLFSAPNQTITIASLEMLHRLITHCSTHVHYTLVQAALIPQLVTSINPLSLSLSEAVDIHINVMKNVDWSFWLATPYGLEDLTIEDDNGQQTVRETVLKKVLVPSEKYILRLCVNRFSIVDCDQSCELMRLLYLLLRICPYYQQTMDFVIHLPVFLTIPSCLTFFENDYPIWSFLTQIFDTWNELNEQGGEVRQMWKTVHRMLRMEGFEDVLEDKLQNDKNKSGGTLIVSYSIRWNIMLGMNIPQRW
ncbi:hypothetical protein BLNAU_21702 [Blattamonas nauphoetae]|uniref:Uncharacterized protein n=1 Tax=Blattamonas nauphoetae TaxID=2049346 RepID=A0ABQ9WXG4_9EUKA|nr:hypothetical protein BLNAU_21702 [Blattamonas nauphoetae]